MTLLQPGPRHFDPGCPHEVAHQALGKVLEGRSGVVGISGVGCGSLAHGYLDLPVLAAPAGRGVSAARGLLQVDPRCRPLVLGGDGELLGEGLADLLRGAASRAPILVLLVDNRVQARTARLPSPTTPGPEGRPGLDPGALLEAAGAWVRRVEQDAAALVATLGEALDAVESGVGMAVVHLRGTCPAAPVVMVGSP